MTVSYEKGNKGQRQEESEDCQGTKGHKKSVLKLH